VYRSRPLAGITGGTVHYTASPAWVTPKRVAEAQLDRIADELTGRTFPGLAYSFIVDEMGVPYRAWDLSTRCWHSAASGRNSRYVGVVYTGDHEPNPAQRIAIRACFADVERQLGRKLDVIEGHGDVYRTVCPGPTWPRWKDQILP
jgi:N-acetylmuramoyl-L-alanine amidase